MKAKLLVGLLTVALGGLTSCSNILEENGVINNVAESGMGELRINLTTDPTVEAITKAGTPEDPSNFTVSIGDTKYTYAQWNGKKLTVPAGNGKTVEAYNMEDADVLSFAWNKPYYKGENTNVDIVAGQIATVIIDCKRANSTLAIDTTGFEPKADETKILCVKSLMAYAEGASDTEGFDLLKKGSSSATESDSVCVKAGIKAWIKLIPAKMADGTPLDPVTTYINDSNTENTPTNAQKKYKVSYTVNQNGQASITITVNDSVEEVKIPIEEIDPYKNTTSETQSNGGGE